MSRHASRRRRHVRRAGLYATAVVLSCAGLAKGQNWVGPSGGSWSNPSNWSGGVVPPEGGGATIALFATVGGVSSLNVVYDGFYTLPFGLSLAAGGSGMPQFASVSVGQHVGTSQMVTGALRLVGGHRGSVSWSQSVGTMIVQGEITAAGTGSISGGHFGIGGSGYL